MNATEALTWVATGIAVLIGLAFTGWLIVEIRRTYKDDL